MRERVELGAAGAFEFAVVDQLDFGARGRLLAAQPGDPGPLPSQRARQGLELANAAAGLALRKALVDRVLPVMAHELDHLCLRRAEHPHGCGGTGLGALEKRNRLVVQRAGVEHEHRNVKLQPLDQVGDYHVFGAKA